MFSVEQQKQLVREAMKEASLAGDKGEDAFGALLVNSNGDICFRAHCTQLQDSDRIAHAETNLLRRACRELNTQSLSGYILVTNAEPCSMCFSAAIKTKITTYYWGAPHGPRMQPALSVEALAQYVTTPLSLCPGILADECQKQISRYRIKNS